MLRLVHTCIYAWTSFRKKSMIYARYSQLTCDLCMEFQELLQGVVGWEALNPIVGHPVLSPALWTLDMPLDIVHQALHALLAVRVLTW